MLNSNRRNLLFRASIVVNVVVIFYAATHFSIDNQKGAPVEIEWQPVHVDGADRSLHSISESAPDVEAEVNRSTELTTPRKLDTTKGITAAQKSHDLSFNQSTVPTDLSNEQSENATSEKSRSGENVLNKETLTALKSLLNCNNKELKPRTYQKGEFWVLENYVSNATEVKCYESVTYTTHAGFEFLENLLPLVNRWMAPISLAVYAPGSDFDKAVKSIQYLRQCSTLSDLVNKFVSFHVFFPERNMPPNIPKSSDILKAEIDCLKPAPYLKVNSTYKSTKDLRFPINVARNIARDASTTHYLLASDIELYPSPNLVPQFLNMVALNQKPLSNSTNPRVFPISIFEVTADAMVPTSKTKLQVMLKTKKAIPFHKSLCPRCHTIPQAAEWIKAKETPTMKVFHVGKRSGKYMNWEPIYIGTNEDPYYDERLSWEGMKDKMTQGYILCVKNYDFMILTNAFIVHKPGIKKLHNDKKRSNIVALQSKLIKNNVFPDLKLIFGTRPGCII